MLLQATKITKQFGQRLVLKGVDCCLDRGESVAILGPNGAGKTTFIQILATLLKPTSGSLTINSEDVLKEPYQFRSQIGLIAHEPNAYLELTPYENLKFYGQLYGVENLEERINELLDYVGLASFAHEEMKIFSSGMVKRFMIAKALIHKPDILLFDEPFTGLDNSAKKLVLKLILDERARGKGIIFTTHDIFLGYEAASRFAFLFSGRINEIANKEEITFADLQERIAGKGVKRLRGKRVKELPLYLIT